MTDEKYNSETILHCMRKYCGESQNKRLWALKIILSQPDITDIDKEYRRFDYWLARGKFPKTYDISPIGDISYGLWCSYG